MDKIKLKTLIVAAYKNELAPLCELSNKHLVMQDGIGFLSAGIGPVAASFGLTHGLKDYTPEIIVTLGTAGIINTAKFKTGDIVLTQSVSTDSGSPDVYTPEKMAGLGCPLPTPFEDLKNQYKLVRVFCPQEITRTESRRKILLDKKHDVENLESYAFYFVAKKFKVPVIGFLGLTNTVGPNAHEEWKKNEEQVCAKLGKVAKNYFDIT